MYTIAVYVKFILCFESNFSGSQISILIIFTIFLAVKSSNYKFTLLPSHPFMFVALAAFRRIPSYLTKSKINKVFVEQFFN